MIVKTAREILQQAKTLANADNSAFTNFFLSTTLLNNAYRDIYDNITNNSTAFSKTLQLNEDTTLPGYVYTIQSVRRLPSNSILYQKQIGGGDRDEGWEVVDGVFKSSHYPVEITYIPIPATITAPDEWIALPSLTAPTKSLQYAYTYNEDTNTLTFEVKNGVMYNTYCGHTLLLSYYMSSWKIFIDGDDVTDRFMKDDTTYPINVQVHDPYMVISYNDGVVMVFTGFERTEWNYRCTEGHTTKGEVHALWTNDKTGFGMVFEEWNTNPTNEQGSRWYLAPFVPDTVLSYPTNALFTYLEYKVAFLIAGLLNMDTSFIEKQLEQAEVAVFANIGGTANVRRINNFQPARRIWTS